MSAQENGSQNLALPTPPAVLIVTAMEEIETTAASVAAQLKLTVEIAASRATAVRLLARRGYSIVVLDQTLAETDAEGADLIWKNAGVAIPLQINFALAGSARLEREIRAALARREREHAAGRHRREGRGGRRTEERDHRHPAGVAAGARQRRTCPRGSKTD